MQLLQRQKSDPWYRNHYIRDAISQAIYDQMAMDKSIHLFGEGCHIKVHYDAPQIERDFSDRVHTLPISEDGNTNFAVGTALLSVKPVVDIITADFLYRAMDGIANTAAKLNFVRPDQQPATIVIRAEFLMGGPTTGQRPEALFAHIPGLNVVVPSTPRDAHGLMLTALQSPGVTLFFEDRMIEDNEFDGRIHTGEAIPFGKAALQRMGIQGNTTIVSYGIMRQRVGRLLSSWTFNGDHLDLRTIYPLDWDTIKTHLGRTGKLLIVEPDVTYGGVGAEIAATIVEEMPRVRVKRVGARKSTIPASIPLHEIMLPSDQEILDALEDLHSD